MTARNILFKVNLEYILCQMQRIRVINFMHPNRLRVMVDCNINRSPQCHLYSYACPSATCETVNNQISHFQKDPL